MQRFELVGFLDRTKLGHIESTVGRKFDSQHVVDTDQSHNGFDAIWMLRQRGPHQ